MAQGPWGPKEGNKAAQMGLRRGIHRSSHASRPQIVALNGARRRYGRAQIRFRRSSIAYCSNLD
jgi:hypothetical protein